MKPDTIKRWSLKLWPKLARYPPDVQQDGFLLMSVILTLWPYLPISLVWLTAVTEWHILRDNALILLLLLAVSTVLAQRPYVLIIRFSDKVELPFTGSLSNILYAAAFFILGPTALWLVTASGILQTVWQGIQARRNRNQHPFWAPLNVLIQASGASVFNILVAAVVYQALGGVFPLAGAALQQWLPALVAILSSALVTVLIYLPMLATVNRLNGVPNTAGSLLSFSVVPIAMFLTTTPFAIPLAVVYTETGTAVFLTLTLGIALANLLASALSRASINNKARVDDLAWLESVSEAMIQAPPDAGALADLLQEQIPRRFRRQPFAVKLFAFENPPPWPVFELAFPLTASPPQPPIDWDTLRRSDEQSLIVHNVPARKDIPTMGHELMTKIMAPLQTGGPPVCVGGIYLHRDRTTIRPPESALATLQDLAGQIGAALTRARSHADTLAQQKMAQELAVAGRIQASFLPHEIPQLPGYEIAAALIPARQTSGDFYDFVPLSNGRLGLIVADVADKGTGAALYMALSRTLIRTYAMEYPDAPGAALAAANTRILSDTQSDQFVTVFFGVLEPENGRFTYANAGHNPAYLLAATAQPLENTGIPLGMFPDMHWREETVCLSPGDVLLLYSDGMTEAQNASQVEFGVFQMLAVADGVKEQPAEAVKDALITAVRHFAGGAPQFDDMTLLVIRRLP